MTLWPFQQVTCFSAPYRRSFVAPRCSAAYCLHLACAAALLFLPLLASFSSDNFWVKEGLYHEQPLVSFAHELLVVLTGDSPDDAVGWGSHAGLEQVLPEQVRVPVVRSTPHDVNHDGAPDTWKLVLEVPMGNASRGYRHVALMAVYNVEMRARILERIGGLVVVDAASPFPATGVWVQGQLKFRQGQPLRVGYEVRDVYAQSPLAVNWTSSWAAAHSPVTRRALLERYADRNETVSLDSVVPPVWDYGPSESFRVTVVIDVPPQCVHYVPGGLEVLKFAWVQFLSFWIIARAALTAVKDFAFGNQLVETYVVSNLPPRSRESDAF